MNTKEYIESGILELYIAGSLTPQENEEVNQNALQYPEIAAEIEAIESAYIDYASSQDKKPDAGLFDKIVSAAGISETSSDRKEKKIIRMKTEKNSTGNFLRYLSYAAVALLFLSGSLNVYYFNRYKNTRNELASLQRDKEYFAGEYSSIKANYDQLAGEMDIVRSPGNIAVTMKGSAIKPDAIATIYWNRSSGNLYLNINNLPEPPSGKQYQLWALKDGKPIDAGVFDMKKQMQNMKNIAAADAFAVTLEPEGGSISPSLEYLYVIGNV